LLLLENGAVVDQARLTPGSLRTDPQELVKTLERFGPVDLIAGPSGYGLPLIAAADLTENDLDQMSLVRPDQRGRNEGVIGFRSWVRALVDSGQPVIFLPGGIHLATVPKHRKVNAIDMGTADKVAVAALAAFFDSQVRGASVGDCTFAVVELGSVFSAILVVEKGRLVDAAAGSRGPLGMGSGGCWDGEVAYWFSPLFKEDLFRGGLRDLGTEGPSAFRESLLKHVTGLNAVTPFNRIYLSGASASDPVIARIAEEALSKLADVVPLPSLPGAWVKHAAQGAALLADGLAGGRHSNLVDSFQLRNAAGTVWDGLSRFSRSEATLPPGVKPGASAAPSN